MDTAPIYTVHGLTRSYFTRKVTSYLDFTDRPWRLEPCPPNLHAEATEAGWTGGIPVVTDPDGHLMWDSTTIIEHLDTATPERSVVPTDPTQRFIAYLLDDFSDEWFYRPAVGSRWNYPGNTEAAGWQIAEELSSLIGMPGGFTRENVVATMTANCPKLGVVDGSIDLDGPLLLVAGGRIRVSGSVRSRMTWRLGSGGGSRFEPSLRPARDLEAVPLRENLLADTFRFGVLSAPIRPPLSVRARSPN